ncbi:MAG: L,D-transpeptidase [Rhodobacteraceae bacterium]|nr:L,D-transpeptidase [Paracoccaceae bacterium]
MSKLSAYNQAFENAELSHPPVHARMEASDWRRHFLNLKNGAILAETDTGTLHFWSEDRSVYRRFETAAPIDPDLRPGLSAKVMRKVVGPKWRPTPEMLEVDPTLPRVVKAGPDNPLGTHALYLSWKADGIHGTSDQDIPTGGIALDNAQMAELFELARVGTQVKLV